MPDWIDDEITRRQQGRIRALDQSQHKAINARYYPGTRQLCDQCGEPTKRCEEDSLYHGDEGPLCKSCYEAGKPEEGGGVTMPGYMVRCPGCGCWTDYSNKAAAVCGDCQRSASITVGAVQPPDAATLQVRITALEALLLEAKTALGPMVPWWTAVQRTNYQDWIKRHKDHVLYSCWYREEGEAKEAAITVDDLRRAAEAHAKLPGGGQGG